MKKMFAALVLCLAMVSVSFGAQDYLKDATSAAKEKAIGKAKEQAAAIADDSALTAEVKLKLKQAPSLKDAPIEVSTTDGVVTLTGEVKTAQAKGAATKMAKGVKGVKSVENELKVAAKKKEKPAKKN
ncbi:MAG: BON domain-containing protein [Nitrospirae bacterium]|nr:BON domain-containing protein [Nitrospirota bacterium]